MQTRRPRIPMRLEEHDQSPAARLGRGQRRADLRRMVTIIIDHYNGGLLSFRRFSGRPIDLSFDLEPALGAAEGLEPLGDQVEFNFEFQPDRHRRERITNIVPARNMEFDSPQILAPAANDESRAEVVARNLLVAGRDLGVSPQTVSDQT